MPAGYDRWEVESGDNIRHEFKNGVLKTYFDPDMANCGEYTRKFIQGKLKLK